MNNEQTRAKLAELVKRYRESDAERDGWLSDYLDDDGDLINPSDFYRSGEVQTDKAYAAEADLLALLDEIEALLRRLTGRAAHRVQSGPLLPYRGRPWWFPVKLGMSYASG